MQYFFGRREQHVWRSFFSLLFAERPARTLPQGISSTEKANTTIVAWAELRVKIIWYQKISANGACQIFASFLPKKWSAENFLPKNWSAQKRVCSLFSTTFKRWWIITFFFERWCRLKETKLYSRRSACPAGEETPGARGSLGKDTSNAIKFIISCIDVDGSDTFIGSAAKTAAAALKSITEGSMKWRRIWTQELQKDNSVGLISLSSSTFATSTQTKLLTQTGHFRTFPASNVGSADSSFQKLTKTADGCLQLAMGFVFSCFRTPWKHHRAKK